MLFKSQCELYHWIDVLDRFDEILENVAKTVEGKTWMFIYDTLPPNQDSDKSVSQSGQPYLLH